MDAAARQCPCTQCDPCTPIPVPDHPPYSPDLASANFFLFPRLKATIKGARFADVNAIKDGVTAVLRSISQEAFADCFRKMYERCQTCVVAGVTIFKNNKEIEKLVFRRRPSVG